MAPPRRKPAPPESDEVQAAHPRPVPGGYGIRRHILPHHRPAGKHDALADPGELVHRRQPADLAQPVQDRLVPGQRDAGHLLPRPGEVGDDVVHLAVVPGDVHRHLRLLEELGQVQLDDLLDLVVRVVRRKGNRSRQLTLQDAVEQLGTELVEAVTKVVVGRREQDEMTPGLEQAHAVADGGREMKDVLQRTPINHDVVLLLPFGGDGLVQIVDQLRAFASEVHWNHCRPRSHGGIECLRGRQRQHQIVLSADDQHPAIREHRCGVFCAIDVQRIGDRPGSGNPIVHFHGRKSGGGECAGHQDISVGQQRRGMHCPGGVKRTHRSPGIQIRIVQFAFEQQVNAAESARRQNLSVGQQGRRVRIPGDT